MQFSGVFMVGEITYIDQDRIGGVIGTGDDDVDFEFVDRTRRKIGDRCIVMGEDIDDGMMLRSPIWYDGYPVGTRLVPKGYVYVAGDSYEYNIRVRRGRLYIYHYEDCLGEAVPDPHQLFAVGRPC